MKLFIFIASLLFIILIVMCDNPTESDIENPVPKIRILFQSEQGTVGLNIMNYDGSNKEFLTFGFNGSFSPNGNKIVYSNQSLPNQGLHIFNLNDSTTTYLNNTTNALPYGIFTPDSSKIVACIYIGGDLEICTIDLDGTNLLNLTNNSYDEDDIYPDISNDNTKIVYCKNDSGTYRYEIHIMNIDGTGKQKLTNNYSDEYRPQFSPDGTKILFFSEMQNTSDDDLLIMNMDGSNIISLADANGLSCWSSLLTEPFGNAQFSPDGNKIVFSASGNIYLINPDGSNLVQLTNSGNIFFPQFSPDGSMIVCQTVRSSQIRHLLLLNASDGTVDTLLSEDNYGFNATFEP